MNNTPQTNYSPSKINTANYCFKVTLSPASGQKFKSAKTHLQEIKVTNSKPVFVKNLTASAIKLKIKMIIIVIPSEAQDLNFRPSFSSSAIIA